MEQLLLISMFSKEWVRQGGMLSPELFDIYIGCVCDKLLYTV